MIRCSNCMKEYDEQYEICPHCGFIRSSQPKELYHLYPETRLHDRYIIGTVLGFGGFGITYRAWDTRLERQVAIKEYYPSGIVNRIPGESEVIIYSGNRSEEFYKGKERFLTEARNMAKFNQNPHIVHVFEFFEENQTAYIAMEFLDGISYKQYIAQAGGKVDVQTALSVVSAVAKALEDIHKTKIIHRDISPDNIFICSNAVVKVIDFGAARFSTGEEEKTMSVILKPGYAPPEQYRGKSKQGPWTDIYALGAVLYRSLTGKMPIESVNRVGKDELKEPKELNPEIPDYLNDTIMRAMALNPELRFRSIDQFLKAINNEKKVRSVEAEIVARKRNRWAGIAGIAAVLCVGGLACAMMYQNKRQQAFGIQAELDVWLKGGADEQAVFANAVTEFNQYYPNIQISLKEMPEKAEEDLAGIFDSRGMSAEELKENAAPFEELGSEIEESQYYLLGQAMETGSELYQIPVGFEIPIIYVNIGVIEDFGEEDAAKLIQEYIADGDFCMDEADAGLYEGIFGGMAQWKTEDAKKSSQFYEKEAGILLGTSEDYETVQSQLTGLYELVWPADLDVEGKILYARFTEAFSMSKGLSEDQQEAAEAFLNYLLSEPGQDILNVRGGLALPLNRNMYAEYITINGELEASETSLDKMELWNE